jgi:hypothetical protein
MLRIPKVAKRRFHDDPMRNIGEKIMNIFAVRKIPALTIVAE